MISWQSVFHCQRLTASCSSSAFSPFAESLALFLGFVLLVPRSLIAGGESGNVAADTEAQDCSFCVVPVLKDATQLRVQSQYSSCWWFAMTEECSHRAHPPFDFIMYRNRVCHAQACYDAARALSAHGGGVQLRRCECFTHACRAIFPGDGAVEGWMETAFSRSNNV